jgi:molybdopterin-guanine dinucleotide biosynthesis protein MobB
VTVKAVAFLGRSGSGKTTLIEKLLPVLAGRGYRVGAVKHDAHRFDIDHPGKDSHRFTAAGAEVMVISSSEKLAVVEKHAASPTVEELLSRFFTNLDIVLVEGFRKSSLPKIEVRRKGREGTLLCRGAEDDPTLLAVASDEPLEIDVPVLDIDDPEKIADFIEDRVLRG